MKNRVKDVYHHNQKVSVDWEPISKSDASYQDVLLHQESDQRIVSKTSKVNYVLAILFLGIGLYVLGLGLSMLWSAITVWLENHSLSVEIIFSLIFAVLPLIVGTVFALLPILWVRHINSIVFDKAIGYFWIGSKKLSNIAEIETLEDACQLSDIVAIQILSKKTEIVDSTYKVSEINLLLNDGGRINLMSHGYKTGITNSSMMLAKFLNVQIIEG